MQAAAKSVAANVSPRRWLSSRPMAAAMRRGTETLYTRGTMRTLRRDFVVRRLLDLGPVPDKGLARVIEETWEPSWRKENAGAAVFLQDPATMAVTDAASVFPLP